MPNPYESLSSEAYWASAVARRDMMAIDGLWKPKFPVEPQTPVATYGSCFAQHIGRALAARGFSWLQTEPAPDGLTAQDAADYNYGIFTARTGNIYTVTLLKQWLDWADGTRRPPAEVWEREGRFYDPFRPRIEPDGFASADEVTLSRLMAIESFARSVREAGVFVFTLGLTESWVNSEAGHEYPMCPGTAAGSFDPAKHRFFNQTTSQIMASLAESTAALRRLNPEVRVLLTVSPVPLTATMSGQHVLVATSNSKARLRAAAGEVAEEHAFVDYFPSYEIITTPPFRGSFFAPNLRSVTTEGVAHVMNSFFACLRHAFGDADAAPDARDLALAKGKAEAEADDLVCEEALLAAFQK